MCSFATPYLRRLALRRKGQDHEIHSVGPFPNVAWFIRCVSTSKFWIPDLLRACFPLVRVTRAFDQNRDSEVDWSRLRHSEGGMEASANGMWIASRKERSSPPGWIGNGPFLFPQSNGDTWQELDERRRRSWLQHPSVFATRRVRPPLRGVRRRLSRLLDLFVAHKVPCRS